MKIKVSETLKGELYVSCLNISLKRGQILDISSDSASHHDIIWALNKGYISFVDVEPAKFMEGKVEIKNITNKTIILPDTNKALYPKSSVYVDASLLNTQGYIYLFEKKLVDKIDSVVARVEEDKEKIIKEKVEVKKMANRAKIVKSKNNAIADEKETDNDAVKVTPVVRKKAQAKPFIPSKIEESSTKNNKLPQNIEVTIDGENK